MYSGMVWSEGALVALKSHKFFGSHYGLIVALRCDQRALGRTMVWSEVFWSHYGRTISWVALQSNQRALGWTMVWSGGKVWEMVWSKRSRVAHLNLGSDLWLDHLQAHTCAPWDRITRSGKVKEMKVRDLSDQKSHRSGMWLKTISHVTIWTKIAKILTEKFLIWTNEQLLFKFNNFLYLYRLIYLFFTSVRQNAVIGIYTHVKLTLRLHLVVWKQSKFCFLSF